jgi:hypothetical protein
MFIILWGTKVRKESLGAVGEWCHGCDKVRVFDVVKYHRASHLYYITIGRWKHVSTVRECWRCGSVYECRSNDYTAFLPDKEAERLSQAEVVNRTNARMPESLRPLASVTACVCPHCQADVRAADDGGDQMTCPRRGKDV